MTYLNITIWFKFLYQNRRHNFDWPNKKLSIATIKPEIFCSSPFKIANRKGHIGTEPQTIKRIVVMISLVLWIIYKKNSSLIEIYNLQLQCKVMNLPACERWLPSEKAHFVNSSERPSTYGCRKTFRVATSFCSLSFCHAYRSKSRQHLQQWEAGECKV